MTSFEICGDSTKARTSLRSWGYACRCAGCPSPGRAVTSEPHKSSVAARRRGDCPTTRKRVECHESQGRRAGRSSRRGSRVRASLGGMAGRQADRSRHRLCARRRDRRHGAQAIAVRRAATGRQGQVRRAEQARRRRRDRVCRDPARRAGCLFDRRGQRARLQLHPDDAKNPVQHGRDPPDRARGGRSQRDRGAGGQQVRHAGRRAGGAAQPSRAR